MKTTVFALQSPAGGFLDEELQRFNKRFDEWCVQFDNYEVKKSRIQLNPPPKAFIILTRKK